MSERLTVTFTKSGQGAGHAARANKIPLCGANVNKPFANPQVQARDWSKVSCARCKRIMEREATGEARAAVAAAEVRGGEQ
ncbi:hypothetical protein EV193_104400 [Herbihabitans rhizosphaerae]|uniref:Uncharacterized protein n=1 Tax=Herbihabitans rhizosphaerae TaxID=1872711 RepID=A0A4Q7KRN0_9PSEU|nr:hypothetical protein [Herbihabitans rhizosphaerae]RZS39184.1 hypothetical protein EV193_104400 [Herbihabitans rhizosphaerae]